MTTNRRVARWIAVFGALVVAAPAFAGVGVVDERVEGNVLEARIALAGGIGADLRFEFEGVAGLEPGALGLSAALVDPLDPALLGRLPASVGLPTAFPVLLRVDPPPGLRLRGIVDVGLHTHNLTYVPGTPLRLFAGAFGGPLEDVTVETGPGSYRAGAAAPQFATEFLIVSDLRPSEVVAALKQDALDGLLGEHAGVIDPAVLADLEERSMRVRQAIAAGDHDAAISELDGFTDAVVDASGVGIPDTWESAQTVANVAGALRSQAATLVYSLLQLIPETP